MPPRLAVLLLVALLGGLAVAGDVAWPGAVRAPATSIAAGEAWIVTGNERVAPGSAIVAGKIIVAAGGTLVLDGVRVVIASNVPCVVAGTRVCVPAITVEAGGRLVLRNATLEGNDPNVLNHPAAHVFGVVEATDSAFRRFAGFVVTGPAASGVFERNAFEDASGAITIHRGASGIIRGNHVRGVGLYVADASVRLEGNVVRDALLGYSISTTIVGARCCRATLAVERNVAERVTLGFFVDSIEAFAMRGNAVRDAPFGVNVTALPEPDAPAVGLPSLEANRFERVGTAVTLGAAASRVPVPAAAPAEATLALRQNDFSGACVGVRVRTDPATVLVSADARENWWGSPDGPAIGGPCPGAEGPVLVDPWLTQAP